MHNLRIEDMVTIIEKKKKFYDELLNYARLHNAFIVTTDRFIE